MKFEKLFEIRAFDREAEEMTSVWYSGDYSMIDLEDILAEENLELDELQTLQLYLDHVWVRNNIDEVLNNREIMNTPLKELLNDYKIYEMAKEITK